MDTINHNLDLIEHYHKFFYMATADTPALLEQVFRLRYQVFIEECGFRFKNQDVLHKIEKDSYDCQSHHCILIHKPSRTLIGYVRLIPYRENNGRLLPIESYGVNFEQSIISRLRTPSAGRNLKVDNSSLFQTQIKRPFV